MEGIYMRMMLSEYYETCKSEIKERLQEFKQTGQGSDEEIFAELCFCLCTPQSKAEYCDQAVNFLCDCGLLFLGTCEEIQPRLTGVRFAPTKSKRIVAAREFFTEKGQISLKKHFNARNPIKLRKWVADTVKGLGYKEASHFLRNIGFGDQLAILDRHILKNLKKFGVIDEIPSTLSKKKYLEIEQQMKQFSKEVNIPLAELDLVFWSMETGKIFK